MDASSHFSHKCSSKSLKNDYFGSSDVKREPPVHRSVPVLGAASFEKTDLGSARRGSGGLEDWRMAPRPRHMQRDNVDMADDWRVPKLVWSWGQAAPSF